MPKKRPYDQYCPIAQALDVVGDRWSMLIVRELFLGAARYGQLSEALTPISTDVLAKRLRELESTQVVAQREDGSYELATEGLRLAPVLKALGQWGRPRLTGLANGLELNAGQALQMLVISTSGMDLGEPRMTEVHAGDSVFTLASGPHGIEAHRGSTSQPDAVINTDGPTLWALGLGELAWEDALSSVAVEVDGDPNAAKQLFTAHEQG